MTMPRLKIVLTGMVLYRDPSIIISMEPHYLGANKNNG
jgi:hypothetical protein